jgi:hypothetical protein
MSKETKPFANRPARTEEQIRTHTIGVLKPLSGRILIVDYDPQWPELFSREAVRIRAVLGPCLSKISKYMSGWGLHFLHNSR